MDEFEFYPLLFPCTVVYNLFCSFCLPPDNPTMDLGSSKKWPKVLDTDKAYNQSCN